MKTRIACLFAGGLCFLICLLIDVLMSMSVALSNESADVFIDFLLSTFSYVLVLGGVFFMWRQTLVVCLCLCVLFFVNISYYHELVQVIEGKIHAEIVYFEPVEAVQAQAMLLKIQHMQSFKFYFYPVLLGIFLLVKRLPVFSK